MVTFDVRPLEEYELDSWDELVAISPAGTIYHTSLWRNLINAGYDNADYTIIGAFAKEGLVGGVCALTRKRVGVETAVTPLITPYTGFVIKAHKSVKASDALAHEGSVLDALVHYLRRYRFQNIQCAPGLVEFRPLVDAGYKLTPRATLEINLRLPEDELWESFDGNVRRNVKKAQKVGYDINNRWDATEAFSIFRQTFLKHGQQCPVPEKLFQQVAEGSELEDHRRRYCAWRGGKLQAFLVTLHYNGRVYYELAATNSDALASGVSSLLIWEMLRDYLTGEWDIFDFVGANTRSISRFKESFNPALRMHLQAEYCSSRRVGFGRGMQRLLRRRS